MSDLSSDLKAAADSCRTAHLILGMYADLFARFEREAMDLESFGPMLATDLYLRAEREPWRKEVRDAFKAAKTFVDAMDRLAERHHQKAGA